MPKSSIQRQEFGQKKPYLIAAVFSLALAIFLLDVAEGKITSAGREGLGQLKSQLDKLNKKNTQLKQAISMRDDLKKGAQDLNTLAENHLFWINILKALRDILMATEANLQLTDPNGAQKIDQGVWVEEFTPILPDNSAFAPVEDNANTPSPVRRPGRPDPRNANNAAANRGGRPQASHDTVVAPPKPAGGQIEEVWLLCRAVDRDAISPTASADLAYEVRKGINASPLFSVIELGDITKTQADTNTFNFRVKVHLKHPFKL